MKKFIGILAALFVMTGFVFADEYYDDNYYEYNDYYYDPEYVDINVNGNYVWFENEVACEINGSIFVPMREMFENLGAEVIWDNESKTAKGILGDKTVEFTIDSDKYKVNGEEKTLPVPAQVKNGCTMLPVRALSEGLGAEVVWNDKRKEVEISFLRPLNKDEQYLYDVLTNKDIPSCEQTGSTKLSIANDDFDLNLNMDIKAVGDANYSYSKIHITGDIYRKVLSVDANIELWSLVDGDNIKMYTSVNGSKADNSIMDLLESVMPDFATSLSSYTQDAIYSLFNNLKISSVKSENGKKIIDFKYKLNDYTPAVSITYYIDEETHLPVKMIMDMESYYKEAFEGEEVACFASPIEIDIKYNVKMPEIPDFLKENISDLVKGE